MNELESSIKVEDMIYEVRGVQVMLDSDLARLYHVETKRINEAVKNNPKKFPERFAWKLTDEESSKFLVEIFDQKSIDTRGGRYKNPRVFTEQGIAMLATILKSDTAINTSILIMDAFVAMKKYISNQILNYNLINSKIEEHDNRLSLVESTLNKLNEKQRINTIFYNGQIFDAYVVLMEILERAKEEIIIIDDYAGKELFKIIKNIDKKIVVITSKINEEDKKKYEKQYRNIEIKQDNKFHDRFIILDRKVLYHSGASFKDLGSKCCCISLIENKKMVYELLDEVDV